MRLTARLFLDNDYGGDPDGLVQLAHHLLSPSMDIRAVVASHLRPGDPFDNSGRSARNGRAAAEKIVELTGRAGHVPVIAGSEEPLTPGERREPGPAAAALIEEALRDDPLPLFACFGGGLTELAVALLAEPAIASRMTAVWIGGAEYPGVHVPAGAPALEYNTAIDIEAARVVFASAVPLWQFPRCAYRQALISRAELATRVAVAGPLGVHLAEAVERVYRFVDAATVPLGESYVMGDSPLVLATALRTVFEPDTGSSEHRIVPRPAVRPDGTFDHTAAGAPVRVFTRLDTRLLFEDLYARLELAAR